MFSSTSNWYNLYTDERVFYTSGIVFVEKNSLSIPITLNGVSITKGNILSIVMGVQGHTSEDGKLVDEIQSSECLSFQLTASDVFDFVSSNSFMLSFLTSLVPSLPKWLDFSISNDSLLATEDLQTRLVYGRDIDQISECSGAAVLPDHLYNVFQFGSGFSIQVYGDSISLPKPLHAHKFCFITDLCQNDGVTVFFMFPEESRHLLAQLNLFKTLNTQHGLEIFPRGIGVSITNGVSVRRDTQGIQLWNGDAMFSYP